MASMDAMLMEEQQPETTTRFRQKKGAWFDWLADEREAEDMGWDFGEWQTKNKKKDDTVNWADPAAWQAPKPAVSKSNAEQPVVRPTSENPIANVVIADRCVLLNEKAKDVKEKALKRSEEIAHQDREAEEQKQKCLQEKLQSLDQRAADELRRKCSLANPHSAKAPHRSVGTIPHQEPIVDCRKHKTKDSKVQRVVWCHEHCHKSHNDVRRKELWRLCRDHDASLVCHKKAAKFQAWLGTTMQPNYILVTDWREAKPCMDIDIMREKSMFTEMIVYCDSEQTYKKASDWASGLPLEAGRVYVTASTFELDKLLLELLTKQSEEQPQAPATPSTACEIDSDQGTDVETDISDQAENEIPMAATMVQFVPLCVPIVVPVAPAVNPVLQVLGPVLSSYSAQELNHELEQAMPDCYMD